MGLTPTSSSGVGASGPAGGDLTGTYPNPSVANINGSPLGTLSGVSTNQVLQWNGSDWVPATAGTIAQAIVGQVVGTTTNGLGSTNMFLVAAFVPAPTLVSKYVFYIGTQNGTMFTAIYNSAGNKVSAESAFNVPAGGPASRTITGGAITLQPGVYYVGVQFSGATATIGLQGGNIALAGLAGNVANTFGNGAPTSITVSSVITGGTCVQLGLSE